MITFLSGKKYERNETNLTFALIYINHVDFENLKPNN